MILTCPECATRYFVQDETLGASGRTVRCTTCRSSWHAMPTAEPTAQAAPLELVLDDEEGAVARAPYDLDVEPAGPAGPAAELTGDDLPKLFRDRVRRSEQMRKAAAAGAVWGLSAAAVVALIGAALVFRADVVRAWPKTASAYALVGLPVNATGLVIEREQADLEFAQGRPALVVRGSIRNVRNSPVPAPPLKVTLLNKAGRAVKTQIASPDAPMIPAGSARFFAVDVLDPPSTVTDVEVRFLLDSEAAKGAKAPKLRTASAEPVAAMAVQGGGELKGAAHE